MSEKRQTEERVLDFAQKDAIVSTARQAVSDLSVSERASLQRGISFVSIEERI